MNILLRLFCMFPVYSITVYVFPGFIVTLITRFLIITFISVSGSAGFVYGFIITCVLISYLPMPS